MPWVRFTADFDWTPPAKKTVTIAFRRGMTLFVTRACAADAIARREAVPVPRPQRKPADVRSR